MKGLECKACSTIIFIKKNQKEPLWCPICRGNMIEIKIKEKGNIKKYNCPECNYEFFIEENIIPYKCANCNYTFVRVEGKIQEERL